MQRTKLPNERESQNCLLLGVNGNPFVSMKNSHMNLLNLEITYFTVYPWLHIIGLVKIRYQR